MPHHPHTFEKHRCKVIQIVEAMRKDPGAELDLNAMARALGMSPFHFLRVFQATTGVTPLRFLAALRMHEAKRLLLETDWQVTAICYEVGYNSLGTFTRLFKELVGLSPGEFRKLGDSMGQEDIELLVADFVQRPVQKQVGRAISGTVHGPHDFHGIVFIGLFDTNIPQRRPIQGAVLLHQGRFELETGFGAPEVRPHCLMAAGFKTQKSVIELLLCRQEDLLVAVAPVGCTCFPNGTERYNLTLRPCALLDPPVLSGLPIFLKQGN